MALACQLYLDGAKKGKISASKKENGGYIVDTSEYDRIQELRKASPNMKGVPKGKVKDIATPSETHVLQIENEVLRKRMGDKDEIIKELRVERDDWKDQAKTLLLRGPQKPEQYAPANDRVAKQALGGQSFAAVVGFILALLLVSFLYFVFIYPL